MYFGKCTLLLSVPVSLPGGHKKGRSSAAKWHEALFVIITQKKMKANFFIPVALLSGSHYNSA